MNIFIIVYVITTILWFLALRNDLNKPVRTMDDADIKIGFIIGLTPVFNTICLVAAIVLSVLKESKRKWYEVLLFIYPKNKQ